MPRRTIETDRNGAWVARGKWEPVRKITAAFIAAGIVWGARRLGLDIGDKEANDAAMVLAPVIVGYVVP